MNRRDPASVGTRHLSQYLRELAEFAVRIGAAHSEWIEKRTVLCAKCKKRIWRAEQRRLKDEREARRNG